MAYPDVYNLYKIALRRNNTPPPPLPLSNIFFVLSLRSEIRAVMTIKIIAHNRCLVRLYLQLFVRVIVSYLHQLCVFAHSGGQHRLCCVFELFFVVYSMLPVSLDCPHLIAPSVFSTVYFLLCETTKFTSRYFKVIVLCIYGKIKLK